VAKTRALSPRPVRPTEANSVATEREVLKLAFQKEEVILFYKCYPTTTQGRREDIILRKVKGNKALTKNK